MTECHFLVVNDFLAFKCYLIYNQIFVQHCSHNCSHWDVYRLCIITQLVYIYLSEKTSSEKWPSSNMLSLCGTAAFCLCGQCIDCSLYLWRCFSYKGIYHCETKINQLISYKKKKGSATSAAFEAHHSWQVWRPVSVQIWPSALHATLILMKVFWITLHSH